MVWAPDEDLFEEYKKVPAHTIQGYFKTKHRLKVGNVNDFISKLRNTKFLGKFLSCKDRENRGIKQVIEEFQRRVSARFDEDYLLSNEM
jgi:phosphoenolpyruvate carboxylase